MILAGDDTIAVDAFIASGLITGYDGAGTASAVFDGVNTTVSAIPEPATMVLLGLGGLLSLRRRRQA